MKKKHLFLLSTLIATQGVLPALSTSALSADAVDRNKANWTIEELLAVKPEFDAYLEEQCGTDLYCIDEFRTEHRSTGGIYGAVAAMEINKIVVSEISPALGKLKVYYMDEYFDHSNSLVAADPITKFELYWIDESTPDPSYGYTGKGFRDYSRLIANGAAAANGIHLISYEYLPEKEVGWFTPYVYHEYTFDPVATLPHNSVYVYAMTEHSSLQRAYDFSKCVPNLTSDNNSCKGVFSNTNYPKYSFVAGEYQTEEEPTLPNTPDTPDTPNIPDNPDTPNTPDAPDNPNTPDTPDIPETPETPDAPDTPSSSEDPNISPDDISSVATPGSTTDTVSNGAPSSTSSTNEATAKPITTTTIATIAKNTVPKNDVETTVETPLGNFIETPASDAVDKQYDYNSRESSNEFPWWILALVGASFGIFFIGFVSKRKK